MRDIYLTIIFSIVGYLAGSVLFARMLVRALGHGDVELLSDDGNPGTANAYKQGGFLCGTLVLVCDICKGFLPVWLYLRFVDIPGMLIDFVLAAPVIGHGFSIYEHFRGGKCIAVSFGVLLGLFPDLAPALILAFFYIVFSAVKIRPHSRRTFISYMCASVAAVFIVRDKAVVLAMWIISAIVQTKHLIEDKGRFVEDKKAVNLKKL